MVLVMILFFGWKVNNQLQHNLSKQRKSELSHRGKALAQLVKLLKQQLSA